MSNNNEIPRYKRIGQNGKRYDASKDGWTRYTVHVEEKTLQDFRNRCEVEGLTQAEGISEAVRYWLASF